MKINILFDFQKVEGGGGKIFLQLLKNQWQQKGVYEENIEKADVILFNSHHFPKAVVQAKKCFPQKIFIHRIDGPMQKYRPKEKFLDRLIYTVNQIVADGTIWQSEWSKRENLALFPYQCFYQKVIFNASDPLLFNAEHKSSFKPNNKVKLVSVSWSQNLLKGFEYLQFLDENLNFQKYEMVFIGRSPFKFKNIKMLGMLDKEKLANVLKNSDIFIFPSQIESCSNSLIEALSCGLPCVAFGGSSNFEIVQKGGEFFRAKEELLEKIEKVTQNYSFYQKNLPIFSLEETILQYLNFANEILEAVKMGLYAAKKINKRKIFYFYQQRVRVFLQKIINAMKIKYDFSF